MQGQKKQHAPAAPVDVLPGPVALSVMLSSHISAAQIVASALPQIHQAAETVATALSAGHTLFFAGAGSSALMALADACEWPGTFGIDPDQIRVCMAGGVPVEGAMPGLTEDDAAAATQAAKQMADGDVAIIVSASGTTPYALAFAEAAKDTGQQIIGIANVADSALLTLANTTICLPTAAEVVEGSTRLGAGTAQKIALNMISTQAGILMGHVFDGMMVNLTPDNAKLRKRAAAIVQSAARVPEEKANEALEQADHDTKLAILIAAGHAPDTARQQLAQTGGRLRTCLARGTQDTTKTKT
ncbi:MAG: N-acetylmuramic acid 6-phosphate etherase [Paracoccaceae bacterium]|nr:N-acetylmuramic acid 6-phosphate etherase [Paracoccaceae bacterium]